MTNTSNHNQIKLLIQNKPTPVELTPKTKYSSRLSKKQRKNKKKKPYNTGSKISNPIQEMEEFSQRLIDIDKILSENKRDLDLLPEQVKDKLYSLDSLINQIKSGQGDKNQHPNDFNSICKGIKKASKQIKQSLATYLDLESELERLERVKFPQINRKKTVLEIGSKNSTLQVNCSGLNPKLITVNKSIKSLQYKIKSNKDHLSLIFTELKKFQEISSNPKSKIKKKYGEQVESIIQSLFEAGTSITSLIHKQNLDLKYKQLKKLVYKNNYPDYIIKDIPEKDTLNQNISVLSDPENGLECSNYDLWEMILCNNYLDNSKAKKIRSKMLDLDIAVTTAQNKFFENQTEENYRELQKAEKLANKYGIGKYHGDRGELAIRYTSEVRKACQEYFISEKNDIVDANGVDALLRQAKNKGDKFASIQLKSSEDRVANNNYIGNNPISVTGKSIHGLSDEIEEKINNAERTIDAKDFYQARKYDSSMKTDPHMKKLITSSFPRIKEERTKEEKIKKVAS